MCEALGNCRSVYWIVGEKLKALRLWGQVLLIVGFGILKCVLLYHFQVKPSFAVIMVVVLDEDRSFIYNIKFIFLGPYKV